MVFHLLLLFHVSILTKKYLDTLLNLPLSGIFPLGDEDLAVVGSVDPLASMFRIFFSLNYRTIFSLLSLLFFFFFLNFLFFFLLIFLKMVNNTIHVITNKYFHFRKQI